MADRIRGVDWSATPLGEIGGWPPSFATAVDIMLGSPAPAALLWGADGLALYNDAFADLIQERHPRSLGMTIFQIWPEIAVPVRRIVDAGLVGAGLSLRDEPVGDGWVDLTSSPVRDERGAPRAVLVAVTETTERRREISALRDSEERFRALANSIPSLCWMADASGWIFWYNRRWYEYGGVTPAEMEGWGWSSMHHPDSLPLVMERWNASIASGEPFEMIFPLKGADGLYRPFLTRIAPVRNESGAIIRWFGINTDITEQTLAEERLKKSEAEFRGLAEAIPNHAWAGGPDGSLNWFNRRVYDYTGAKVGELDGDRWGTVVHPEDLPRAAAAWAGAIAERTPYEVEFRLRRHDGAWFWFLARAMPVMDDNGRIIRWIGTNTDITRQRESEAALRALNESLETRVAERTADRDRMWRQSQDLMVVVPDARDAVMLAVNPAWTRILGWTEAELIGRPASDFVHPGDVSLAHGTAPFPHDVSEDGYSFARYENRYRHKDGGWRWISWSAVIVGDLLQAVGRDVTADKEQAEALAQAEEQLRQAQKMEAVGQLTGGIAHDFNNMLAIVIGNLGLLKRRLEKGDARIERFAESALEGANRAAALTNRLLAFSRQQPLKPETVEASRLVAGMCEMLARTLGEATMIETVQGPELWRAHIDPHQLESAILNLALNARDAMPEGGRLTIETANADLEAVASANAAGVPAGQYVMITVTDTGGGMTVEILSRAFDPFFTTKPVGKGTGLGLSQVYGFVRQSGGHVKIRSEIGAGTSVRLYLPRFVGPEETIEPAAAEPIALATGATTILIVEDEASVRRLGVEALKELGYRVLEADGAAMALRLLDKHPEIALLFTDIAMPEMDGRQLAVEAARRRPGLKILFTTGYTGAQAGMPDPSASVVGKPFTIEQLAAGLRAKLEG